MTRWEYMSVTLRIAQGQGKVPGFFNRAASVRYISAESEQELNTLGQLGWELVTVLLLDLGSVEAGPAHACAMLKRPVHD
jgi:hypothetical protein